MYKTAIGISISVQYTINAALDDPTTFEPQLETVENIIEQYNAVYRSRRSKRNNSETTTDTNE